MKFVFYILLFIVCSQVFSQDITPPDTPELLYVTVINNDQVYIKWQASDSADTKGYIIFKNIINWEPIDTVLGITTTNYTELSSGANYESKKYRIAAFDYNDNVSPMTDINEYHLCLSIPGSTEL